MSGDGDEADVTHPDRGHGPKRVRRRRVLYAVTTTVLCVLALLVIVDVRGGVFGVDEGHGEARAADGTLLRVAYPAVTRPALASPFAIEVRREDGFLNPIELAVSRPWVEVWDENGLYPTPSSETADDEWVVWEFDPPDGELFRFFYDARLEPARQFGVDGRVELRENGVPVAAVDFRTVVRP